MHYQLNSDGKCFRDGQETPRVALDKGDTASVVYSDGTEYQLGELIRVRGVSSKGRQRINQYGIDWMIVLIYPACLYFKGRSGILLRSTQGENYTRWMEPFHDSDFQRVA